MVDCLTLCNSACIACIWCFFLSICFPKFVKIVAESESNLSCESKCRIARESFETDVNNEIKKRNGERREVDASREKDVEIPMRRHDPTNILHRKSKDIEFSPEDRSFFRERSHSLKTLDSERIDNFDDRKLLNDRLNRTRRSIGDQTRRYDERSIEATSEQEKYSFGKNKRPVVEFYCRNPKKCDECRNLRSTHNKNINSFWKG